MQQNEGGAKEAATKHILIVEDNIPINEALTWIFENEGLRVVRVNNGLEALNLLKNDPLPAVICLDLMMPLMDGLIFRQRQKSDPRIAAIPTIIMSASFSKGERLENFQDEIFLTKPLNLDKLLQLVKPFFLGA